MLVLTPLSVWRVEIMSQEPSVSPAVRRVSASRMDSSNSPELDWEKTSEQHLSLASGSPFQLWLSESTAGFCVCFEARVEKQNDPSKPAALLYVVAIDLLICCCE